METITENKNRILKLFRDKKQQILSVFFTAGFPELNDTEAIIKSLAESGADMIEIGMPFSDPIADGPTIQNSNYIALKNGITLPKIFDQLKEIRKEVDIPLLLMGYINPVLQYGIEKFCSDCAETGIDGVILPDLPVIDYQKFYKETFDRYGLFNIFLITPQTSEARIRMIDDCSQGFIYMVSSASTTGAKTGISEQQIQYFERIRNMELSNPLLIGFGISDRETFETASKYASGAIIGSAFIKLLEENSKNYQTAIKNYIHTVKGI